MTPDELAAIRERADAAHAMVSALNHRRERWVLRVPAEPDRDPDLVITASLRDITDLLAELDRLRDTARLVAQWADAVDPMPDELRDELRDLGRLARGDAP